MGADVVAVAVVVVDEKLPKLGVAWRPQLAWFIEQRSDIAVIELLAENLYLKGSLPSPLEILQRRGVEIILHGVGLSLGSAELPEQKRLSFLAEQAKKVGATCISEHIAFVRGGGQETGHLLPVPRNNAMAQIICENIERAQEAFEIPLVLENIAALFEYSESEMDECEFLTIITQRTGCQLLLDISNLYANAFNFGSSRDSDSALQLACSYLASLPLDRIRYVHVAGGEERHGFYDDTHAHAIPDEIFDLLSELIRRHAPPAVMLERDDNFVPEKMFNAELDKIVTTFSTRSAREQVRLATSRTSN